jgi:tetratricopeptide (TPR) repeat protein
MFVVVLGGLLLSAGCASDPNVEGARLDLKNNDYNRALENVNKALDKNPKNATALRLKGEILMKQARSVKKDVEKRSKLVQRSLDAYEKAVEVKPDLESRVTKMMRQSYVKEFEKGSKAFERGKKEKSAYNAAAQYFKNASMMQPDSTGPYVNRAFALMNAGDREAAIEPLETAIEMGADEVQNYRFLANLYWKTDRSDEVIALLEEARGKYPDNADIQSLLLNAYINAGETEQAMETYRSAIEKEPNNKLYRYNYGSLLLEAKRYDEAIEQLERAVEVDPEYTNAQYNLGAAHVQKAVAANDSLRKINEKFRGNREQMSQSERKEMRARMKKLSKKRESNFSAAIPVLEKAYNLTKAAGDDTQGICKSLYQAYVQTGQEEKAQSYSDCAGFEDKTSSSQ